MNIRDFFRRLFRRKSDESKPRRDLPQQRVRCENCGYEGDISRFLEEDNWDTICPKCGEKDNHTYDL